jgi:hypothetical protein
VIAHLAIAFAGVVLLLRRERCSADAAFLGATVFALSGYVLSAASSLNAVTTIAWIPWAIVIASAPRPAWWHPLLLSVFFVSGEPVLVAFALLLALIRAALGEGGRRRAVRFVLLCAIAAVATSPAHIATIRAALESFRVVSGYSFEHASAASLHPARLLEVIFPFVFGRPDRLLAGGFWGFITTAGREPYVFSVTVSLTALALVFQSRGVRYPERRYWIGVTIACLTIALLGRTVVSEWLFEHLAFLQVFRFPIRLVVFATLGIAVLGAHAFDALLSGAKGVSARTLAVMALVFTAAALFATPSVVLRLLSLAWDATSKADPNVVLSPIADAVRLRLFAAAAIFATVAWAVARRKGGIRPALLQIVCVLEGVALAAVLLPAVDARLYEQRSPLVSAAASLPGRVYERAAKDIFAVKYGLLGYYATDDVRELAVAQARQGWSLGGAANGIRYAFDRTADGSYTARGERVAALVEQMPWERRLRFLKGEGVAGLILPHLGAPPPELREIARENASGIPAVLYAIANPLGEARRVDVALSARSEDEAIALLSREQFDPLASIVIEPAWQGKAPAIDVGRAAKRAIVTTGDRAAWLFVATSYSRWTTATIDGRPAAVHPANVHLVAVRVAAGTSRVTFQK